MRLSALARSGLAAMCLAAALHGPLFAAPTLYASSTHTPSTPSDFYLVDVTTAATTLVGPIGFNRVGAMARHPETGVIYATAQRPGDEVSVLITINPATGAGTEIGPTNFPGPTTVARGAVADLAFRRSDAKLFAYHASNQPGHNLYTIDIATGAATVVGATTLISEAGNGIVFSKQNVLYHADAVNLHSLNQNTGAATTIVPISYSGLPDARTSAMDCHPETDSLIAMIRTTTGSWLGTLHPDSGTVTLIGECPVEGLDGLVFADQVTTDVPGTATRPGLRLEGASPNPFADRTSIRFHLPRSSRVRLDVLDARGRRVRTLLDEERGAGDWTVSFQSAELRSGTYWIRLRAAGESVSRSLSLVR